MNEDKQTLLRDSYHGLCRVCGEASTFTRAHPSLREGYACLTCRSSNRYRGQAELLLELLAPEGVPSLRALVDSGALQQLDIYEPGVSGPFRRYFQHLPGYRKSFYWPDVPPGEEREGVQCQDLERLTFASDSLDLVITSDIMEHVRHPWAAFQELHRVLKPGGWHVFSIPVQKPMRAKTFYRVDTSGQEDIHLVEPRFHGDGAGGQSLVYVDYGWDLVDKLTAMGFSVVLHSPAGANEEAGRLVTFAGRKSSIASSSGQPQESAD